MSQRNASTTYNCVLSITAFFVTVSSSPALAAQLTFDVVVKNEALGNISLETITQTVPGGTRDAIVGQFVATKNDWKNFLGVDHLNWLQIVTQDFHPVATLANPDRTLTVPYIDPPNLGYFTSGWSDEEPWYWDEYTPMAKYSVDVLPPDFPPWNPSAQLSQQTQNNGQVLKFSDVPRDTKANQLKFETFLVGDFGNKTYDFLAGFSWSVSLNPNLTSTITDIRQGATFTQLYATIVEQEFGYKKVERFPTYLYSSVLAPGNVDSFTESGLQPSTPFVAWTNNFPGVNPPRKPDTILGAFNQSGNRIAINDDGGPFASNCGSAIRNNVNEDGSIALKVTGYNDFNFDGRNDFNGGPCNSSSGGGGCVRNLPHPQSGKYDLAVKMYQNFFPSRSSVSGLASNVSNNTRSLAAGSINREMSFSASEVSDIAGLYSDDLPSKKVSANQNGDDALPAETAPEPTTALGTLLALGGLSLFAKLKRTKTKD